mmetsp:Transcript_61714/g.191176  ORF Transcript_61714/g.191176 Transcript_61714/m.191176 type:complete len:208 (+) Transcript_61714:366-989(+)
MSARTPRPIKGSRSRWGNECRLPRADGGQSGRASANSTPCEKNGCPSRAGGCCADHAPEREWRGDATIELQRRRGVAWLLLPLLRKWLLREQPTLRGVAVRKRHSLRAGVGLCPLQIQGPRWGELRQPGLHFGVLLAPRPLQLLLQRPHLPDELREAHLVEVQVIVGLVQLAVEAGAELPLRLARLWVDDILVLHVPGHQLFDGGAV